MLRLSAVVVLGALVVGCGTIGLPEGGRPDPDVPRARLTSPPPPARGEEREHARILASYGGAYSDVALQAYIETTIERLVAASERPDLRYRLTILNSPSVNAFALPSGSLYVTRGLLALANDRAELASVLAHEMAHVVARHAVAREEQVRQAAIVSKVISDVLQDPQLGALSMARSKLSIASFSRQQELEADVIGVATSARAGFDPYGASRFLSSLARHGALRDQALGSDRAVSDTVDFLSSHPSAPDRLSIAITNARQFAGPGDAGERDRDGYLARIDGLTYGDDPSEGYVRGRRFIHPKLGFTLIAPDGFSLENTAQAVLGASLGGREALRLDAARMGGTDDLSGYLSSGWIEGVETASVEVLNLNGFEAATAVARGKEWSFRLYAIRFGSEVYRLIFAARALTPDIDRQFQTAAQTFRRVSLEEADRLRPLRLKIVTVGPGETADSFADRMAQLDRPVERFVVLNGLDRAKPLQAGQKVKTVVE
ncbi:Putative Zn-dependent protease [Blastochloris viridis]|uniref:Putative Zn-dependent protease n=1 Tax=Blastochloris viridis TaxID=1079 RepID=A0A0S4Q622_BLAVI|nr:Putative Zn-dependent protease [Blastochloris viridis]